ncbi:MAG: hypothetical protein JWL69_4915 [Phycisphaerales bacterium]|nr:hypothetical protein [Phycisphaerales bacterium]
MAEDTKETVETRNGCDIVKRTKPITSETGHPMTHTWYDVMKGKRIVEKKLRGLEEARKVADGAK